LVLSVELLPFFLHLLLLLLLLRVLRVLRVLLVVARTRPPRARGPY
jgi:hypothetical protein